MSVNPSMKLHSLLTILGQLDSGKKTTAVQLAKSMGVTERSVYRYMLTLQHAGYPIYFDRDKMSYRFADGFKLRQNNDQSEISLGLDLKSRMLGATPVGLLSYDAAGKCVVANEAAAKIVGGSSQELLGGNFLEMTSWKESGLLSAAQEVLKTGREQSGDFLFLTSSGIKIWLYCTLSRFEQYGNGYLMIVMHDLSERKQMELQLKHYADCFEILTRTTLDAFWIVNSEGRFKTVNDRACQLSGYSREEMLRMKIKDIEANESPAEVSAHVRRVLENGYDRFESRHRHKDGTVVDVEVSTSRIPDSGDAIAFVRDITGPRNISE